MKLEFSAVKYIEIPNIFKGAKLERLKRSLFAILLRQKDRLFQQSKGPDGKPWQKLADPTAARKEKKNRPQKEIDALNEKRAKQGKTQLKPHMILIDTAALKNSLTAAGAPYQITSSKPFEVAIGTNLPYAAIQNFGGTISRKTIKGQTKIVIPARTFMGFGKADDKEVNEKIAAFIKKQGA